MDSPLPEVETLFRGQAGHKYESVEVDPGTGRVYYLYSFLAPVQWVSSDGTVSGESLRGLAGVNDFTLDTQRGWIYAIGADSTFTYQVVRSKLDGSGYEVIVSDLGQYPEKIAFDTQNEKVYWTEPNANRVRSVAATGGAVQVIVSGFDVRQARSLAVDSEAGNIFWAPSSGPMWRANLGGYNKVKFIDEGLSVNDISIDAEGGYVYWADSNNQFSGTTILRASLADGSGVEEVVSGLIHVRHIFAGSQGGDLYWSEEGASSLYGTYVQALQRIPLAQLDTSVPIVEGVAGLTSVAVDDLEQKVYWASTGANLIRRSNFDGTSVEDVVSALAPADFTVERRSGKLYWVEQWTGLLRRSNLDGSASETLLSGLAQPNALALDVAGGKIYWSEVASSSGLLRRADLDGSNVETLNTDPAYALGLYFDEATSILYWTDFVANALYRSSVETWAPELIMRALPNPPFVDDRGTPAGLTGDPNLGVLYWADRTSKEVLRVDFDGENLGLVLSAAPNVPTDVALSGVGVSDLAVHFKRPAGWGLPRVIYNDPIPAGPGSHALGEPMVAEGCGWYRYVLEGTHTATITFSGYPAAGEPRTVPLSRGETGWFVPDEAASGDLTGTWHASNPDGACSETSYFSVKMALQSVYDTDTERMPTTLLDEGLLPARQPFADPVYDGTPLEYNGSEMLSTMDPDVLARAVDWVLIELRSTRFDAASVVAQRAGLLLDTGQVFDPEEDTFIRFRDAPGARQVVVRHRNHLDVAFPLLMSTGSGRNFGIDFRTAGSQAQPMVLLDDGRTWALWSGDGDLDGEVTARDLVDVHELGLGQTGVYHRGDFNLDGNVDVLDVLNAWLLSNGAH
ncbi:MAG: hypothetical protein AAGI08_10490 [Bacteroidota bacterium]